MPLTSFEGGNIKDITFVPADMLTVRLEYKYSPTGGLAGMDAADSQVFQIKVDGVTWNDDGTATVDAPFTRTWDLPSFNGTISSPTLEGFRIVLNPAPLNAFLKAPGLAEQAMEGKLTVDQIRQALESDAFSVNVDNAEMPVYQSQVDGTPQNKTYLNRYSDLYNKAWDNTRSIESTEVPRYTARAVQKAATEHQGANPLLDPRLALELTAEQCAAALNSDSEIMVTVYYRRNAGFYHVGHWVPKTSLSADDVRTYTDQYPGYNQSGAAPFEQNYLMVYLERKQGRVGALTNARANPNILKSFIPRAVTQKIIEADTRVDILYDTADRYGLIFQVEDSYIPRQYVNKGDTVTFKSGEAANSGMEVTDSGGNSVSRVDYKNPTRQGYTFAGWKYEVRSDVTGDDVTEEENGKHYKIVAANGTRWEITEDMVDEAVVIRDTNSGDARMICLYPVWTPDMANVRVVFWTEDLGGGAKDADVNVTIENNQNRDDVVYLNHLDGDYLSGTPATVGSSFSNVGSFTFMAPTNSELDLFMDGDAFATKVTDSFTTTGEVTESGADANKTDELNDLIDAMFPVKMPDVSTSTGSIDTSKFYHSYSVQTPPSTPDPLFKPEHSSAKYKVAADGSTVINVYYARKVYTLDLTYYGEIKKEDNCLGGIHYDGSDGLVVATNTIGYSKGPVGNGFKYSYQNNDTKNRWQRVDVTTAPQWTVPQIITISAKYDADLREVWPLSRSEEIKLTLGALEDTNLKDVAVFMSWGTTAGPFNKTYRDGKSNESTIIGNYRSMSADIIADPEDTSAVHHLVAYWWNKVLSNYRRNACYTELLGASDTLTYDLKNRTIVYNFNFTDTFANVPLYGGATNYISKDEADRRDTLYLVPVKGSLRGYFEDYDSNFIRVNENGEPTEDGKYYAVRWIDPVDDPYPEGTNPEVYALGRQASSVSTNNILNQAPTAMPNMKSISLKYVCEGNSTNIQVDHDTRAWDNWGRTAESSSDTEKQYFVGLGTAENPYDIWFYYKRERFTIHYMVASRNSTSGEYEIGHHETIYG